MNTRYDDLHATAQRTRSTERPLNGLALRLLAATGARRGEDCGLRWNDVDLDAGVMRIRSAVAQLADGSLVEKEPKIHQQREVALDSHTIELLRRHQVEQRDQLAALGIVRRLRRASAIASRPWRRSTRTKGHRGDAETAEAIGAMLTNPKTKRS